VRHHTAKAAGYKGGSAVERDNDERITREGSRKPAQQRRVPGVRPCPEL
jgi:hypothetical protein